MRAVTDLSSIFKVENRLIVVLAVAEAALLLDRLSLGFLAPFLATDMHLTNLQLGLLSSLFSASFALCGYAISGISDRSGKRWTWLILLVVLFSAVSALSGFSTGFAQLAAARVVLGIFEGPFLPIALALMASHSAPKRRTFNLAFVQNFGAFVLAQLAGPIVIVYVAVQFGWRSAFIFTAVPGVIVAVLMWLLSRAAPDAAEPPIEPAKIIAAAVPNTSILQRNVVLCVAIAACMGSWILLQMAFLPKYLVEIAGMTPTHMSFVISLLGVGGCLSSLILPVASDRYGRRAVLLFGTALAMSAPLGALLAHDSPGILTASILIGSIAFGCSPLYVAIIPSETVGPWARARAVALVSASSAVVGGILAPTIGGRLADAYGLGLPLWLAAVLSTMAIILSCFLKPAAGPSRYRERGTVLLSSNPR